MCNAIAVTQHTRLTLIAFLHQRTIVRMSPALYYTLTVCVYIYNFYIIIVFCCLVIISNSSTVCLNRYRTIILYAYVCVCAALIIIRLMQPVHVCVHEFVLVMRSFTEMPRENG